MRVLYDGPWPVQYGQLDLLTAGSTGGALPDPERGELLVGASAPGALRLLTGIAAGDLRLQVRWADAGLDADDDLEPDWEDVAEASLDGPHPPALVAWAGTAARELEVPAGPWRVQWAVRAFGTTENDPADEDPAVPSAAEREAYRLTLWSASPSEQSLRRASPAAARAYGGAPWRAVAERDGPDADELLDKGFLNAPEQVQRRLLVQAAARVIAVASLPLDIVGDHMRLHGRQDEKDAAIAYLQRATGRAHARHAVGGDSWRQELQAPLFVLTAIQVLHQGFAPSAMPFLHAREALGEQWPRTRSLLLQDLESQQR